MRLIKTILISTAVVLLCQGGMATAQDGGKKKKKEKASSATSAKGDSKEEQARLERILIEAEKSKAIEDWDEAISKYKEILSLSPSNANAHYQLAQIYKTQNKLTEAETEAAAATKLDNSNRWYMETLADIYLGQGKIKDAEGLLKSLVEKFPNNPDYYLQLGFVYSRVGQLENAIKVYDQFEKNFGVDEQVVGEKKNLYMRLGKFTEAVAEVDKLIDAYPGEVEYLLMEAELYRAKKMKDKAIELYKKVLEIEPDNPYAQLGLAEFGMASTNDTQKKESVIDIFKNPKVGIDTKVSILLISYIQMNSEDSAKRKEALELAKILTDVHPTEAKAWAVSGDLYYIDNQLPGALAAYKRALSINKDVFQVWQQVMAIYNQNRDWQNVIEVTGEAMELFPNQAIIYLFRGNAETQLKDYDHALKTYGRGEKMSAGNDKLHAQFFANLGDTYHSLNRSTESDSAYDKSLRLDPENAYVLNNYSYYLSIRKQNLEKAKQMSAYANKLEPNNDSFLDTYAWIMFQLGDFNAAKEAQEKAMKAGGDQSGTILEHYGDILSKLGKKDEALNYWKKAKELGTDSSTIDKKIAEQKYFE